MSTELIKDIVLYISATGKGEGGGGRGVLGERRVRGEEVEETEREEKKNTRSLLSMFHVSCIKWSGNTGQTSLPSPVSSGSRVKQTVTDLLGEVRNIQNCNASEEELFTEANSAVL